MGGKTTPGGQGHYDVHLTIRTNTDNKKDIEAAVLHWLAESSVVVGVEDVHVIAVRDRIRLEKEQLMDELAPGPSPERLRRQNGKSND